MLLQSKLGVKRFLLSLIAVIFKDLPSHPFEYTYTEVYLKTTHTEKNVFLKKKKIVFFPPKLLNKPMCKSNR